MCPPEPTPRTYSKLARYTPDSRRWRYALAGLGAMAAPLLFYCTVLLISSAWSGTLPNLLVLLGSVLTLLAAAAVPTVLLAPRGNGGTRASTEPEDGAIAELRRRYASGAVSEEEFERRLGTLIEAPTEAGERSFAAGGPRETVRAPADAESEPE